MYTIYLTGGRLWGGYSTHAEVRAQLCGSGSLLPHVDSESTLLFCCRACPRLPSLRTFFLSLPSCLIVRVCDYKYVSP